MSEYKIYRYFDGDLMDKSEPPFSIDYRKLDHHKLQKVCVFNRGRVMEKGFYHSATKDPLGRLIGQDLVVLERYTWKDVNGMLDERTVEYIWVREDDSLGSSKGPFITNISSDDAIKEGITRRNNVINNMSPTVIGMLAMTETSGDEALAKSIGQSFMGSQLGLIQEYIQTSSTSLYGAIGANLVDAWLNNVIDAGSGATIRHYIMGELS